MGGRQKAFHRLAHHGLGLLSHVRGGRRRLGEREEAVEAGGHVECSRWSWMVVDERDERVGTELVALGHRTSTRCVSPLRSPDWGQSVSKVPCRCSAATFPDHTTPLLTSHATFLQVSIPYPSLLTSIWSDLRPSAIILYPFSRIHISTAHILRILCPILVHVCSGSSVSFSTFFPYHFPLLYLCLLRYLLFVCPGFYLAASDYFRLPFFLL
jgi:hypothetical protein